MGTAMGDRKTIVAVDDNQGLLRLLTTFLEQAGYSITTCTSADEGYRRIRDLHPDLAILDVRVPPAPAWQIVDQVQTDPATADVALLICSASFEELTERADWLREHRCETIVKPFRSAALLEQVHQLIGGPERSPAAPSDPPARAQ